MKLREKTKYTEGVFRTLKKIEDFCVEQTGERNVWMVGSTRYYFEWPLYGETLDGTVEGDIYEEVGSVSKIVGSYLIDGTGVIIEFPFLPEKEIK